MNIGKFINDYLIPKDKWQNHGDVNYVEYGGTQLKYVDRNSIDILELVTPDSNREDSFLLFSGCVTLSDIILNYSENQSIESVEIDLEKLNGVVSFIGIENLIKEFYSSRDPKILKLIIDSICCGAISYGLTGQLDTEWKFKDYKHEIEEDDIESYMLNIVRKDLKNLKLDT